MVARAEVCGSTLDGKICLERGDHFCVPRADRVQAFFEEALQHTKGTFARKRFLLAAWQRDDLIRPIFGKVRWDSEWSRYVRSTRIVWIELSRKQGKALPLDTPLLTPGGWSTIGDIAVGDEVFGPDGQPVRVVATSEPFKRRRCYRVVFSDGRSLVADESHEWTVTDRAGHRSAERVVSTSEIAAGWTVGNRATHRERRYSVPVPHPVELPEVSLPLDPYLLGCWLGDGTTSRAEMTSADPEVIDAFVAAGYPSSYRYRRGAAQTVGFLGLVPLLKRMSLIGDKHVPVAYLTASIAQRRALLAGLMDTDGSAMAHPHRASSSRVEFCSTKESLAESVLWLARSLGYKATVAKSRAMLRGVDCGPRFRVTWAAYRDDSPFRLARKSERLPIRPATPARSSTLQIVDVQRAQPQTTRCIQVARADGMFLAGDELVPTHNSELLAGMALYLLCADDEEGAEIYGCAKDRDQARKVFDVAQRMVELSPILSKRLTIKAAAKRILNLKTASYYEVIAADAAGNLGHNPHGIVFDEVLTQPNGDLWNALRTAMGTRVQPLMIAATTPGNDAGSWCGTMHDEMVKIADDPDRSPHILAYLRNTPEDADPWDEANWYHANPALGDFLSLQALREEAQEARNDPQKENAFRQYRLSQWTRQAFRWMPMHLWDGCSGDVWTQPDYGREQLLGATAWAGLDLAAKFDLTAWCLLVPSDGMMHALWRFWIPEEALVDLDRHQDGKWTRWAQEGWIKITDGNVVDYQTIYADIEKDAQDFFIAAGDADQWSMAPVIQEIEARTGIEELVAYPNTYARMTPGLNEVMAFVRAGTLQHHNNPVARACFDAAQVRHAPYDSELIRVDKPDRTPTAVRIDAVPALAMAASAWRRSTGDDSGAGWMMSL